MQINDLRLTKRIGVVSVIGLAIATVAVAQFGSPARPAAMMQTTPSPEVTPAQSRETRVSVDGRPIETNARGDINYRSSSKLHTSESGSAAVTVSQFQTSASPSPFPVPTPSTHVTVRVDNGSGHEVNATGSTHIKSSGTSSGGRTFQSTRVRSTGSANVHVSQ